jgi:hypothetical protein
MITAHVKNFTDFLHGKEVIATVNDNNRIERGQHVHAVKDSIAASVAVPVPQSKLHESMGVEATVVSADTAPDGKTQTVVIKKD